jgi:signal transduction histidine kinase
MDASSSGNEATNISGTPLLEVGVGCLPQDGKDYPFEAAAESLVGQALAEVHPERLPVRGFLLLATADWCSTDRPLCRELLLEIERRVGYRVSLIGGSMAKVFCSKAPNFVMEQGVVLAALCSRDFWMSALLLEKPHKDRDGRESELKAFAEKLESKAGTRLGASASRHLLGVFPGIFRDGDGQLHYWDHELHEEILKAFGYQYPLIGGAAANGVDPTLGYQFVDDKCSESSLAMAIVESDLAWGSRMGHGFEADRDSCVAVDALAGGVESGYEVETLDGRPAAERLRELQKTHPMLSGRFCLGLAAGEDYHVITAFEPATGELGNRVRLTRRVRRGDRLYVLHVEKAGLDRTAETVAKAAIASADAPPGAMKLLWGMACSGRLGIMEALGIPWEERVRRLNTVYPGIPKIGGLCGGEFGIDEWGRARANTFTFWAGCMASAHTKGAKNRDLQRELVEAAGRLSRYRTPREVMQEALKEALRAGALGGMICIVDREIGKIIGRNLGSSLSATDPPPELKQEWDKVRQDWRSVADKTVRDIPRQVGQRFPLRLLNYAMKLDPGVPLELTTMPLREEDILTLITRTRCAVLVTDAERLTPGKESFFHCDTDASRAGNVQRFLAIPLVGSGGQVIATLQVGFQLDVSIDRETFGIWVSFGQKLAAALERAQEAEEREAMEQISQTANRTMQSPADSVSGEVDWCNDYVRVVRDALGAGDVDVQTLDVHMRILHGGAVGAKELHLIGAAGFLAESRKQTRPATGQGDGTCYSELLRNEARFKNTQEEMKEWNRKVHAIQGTAEQRAEFERQLAFVQAAGVVPVCDHEVVLGSLVVESQQEYFFTERRRRIIKAAAALGGAVLCNRQIAMEKARLEKECSRILEALSAAGGDRADASLRDIVARVALFFGASAASLYIWHETPCQKLILAIAHKWATGREQEGKACYDLGEGWTGSLAQPGPTVRSSGPWTERPASCSGKYDSYIFGPAAENKPEEPEGRIGLHLGTAERLVGILAFFFRGETVDGLVEKRSRLEEIARGLAAVVRLSVQAACQETHARRFKRLHTAETKVADAIFEAAKVGGSDPGDHGHWGAVMEAIRDQFRVDSAAYYVYVGQELVLDSFAGKAGGGSSEQCPPRLSAAGVLQEVLAGRMVAFGENQSYLLPEYKGLKGVLLLPITGRPGSVLGVLALLNHEPDRDHPFSSFDVIDQNFLCDIGRMLGAGIERRQHLISERELSKRLEIAIKVGATSIASGLVMHRLLAPFARIKAACDWLRLHSESPYTERAERLEHIRDAVSNAVETIHSVRQTSAPRPHWESLRTIVAEAMRHVQADIQAKGVKVNLANNTDVNIYVDVASIVGALVSLLSNAIDALSSSDRLVIVTELLSPQLKAMIRIRNTGPAVTTDEISRFFQPGFTTKGTEHHLGWGLSIAKQAIVASGGTIDLVPSPDGGVEARVAFPLATDETEMSAAAK